MPDGRKTVCVIGAGIVGVVAAALLQREGHDIVVVEPGGPGEGASFGNAGCLSASSVVPLSMPGTARGIARSIRDPMGPLAIRWRHLPSVAPWLVRFVRSGTHAKVRAQARALRPLLAPSVVLYASLLEEMGARDLLRSVGHLYVYRSEASWLKERLHWQLRRENGIDWDELDAHALREFDPSLSTEYVRGALLAANGHVTNPHRVVTAILAGILARGGRLVRGRAVGFDLDGTRLEAVRMEHGVLSADAAVVTAGAWSKPLAAALGDPVPLESQRGYHLMLSDPEVSPRVPTNDADGKFMVTPMELGLRAAGTVEFAGLRAPPNWERAHILMRHARRMLPGLRASYEAERLTKWMGHRPSLPDSLPVIGRSRRTPDVVYAFGHGHVGLAAAPMTGGIVTDLVGGKQPRVDIEPFSASRFG